MIGEKLSEKELCPDELLKGQEEAFQRDIEKLQKLTSDFVKVNCPACNSSRNIISLQKFGFDYVECEECKTLFMNPRPSPEIMADYYKNSENYNYWAKYIFPASEKTRREKINKPWLKRIINYCKKYSIKQGALLEVGAGFGTFAELAQKSQEFGKVIAIEPTPEMAEACQKKEIFTINKRIEDIKEEVNPVDIIVSFEVIEHLFNPKDFLEKCSKLIKQGGLLIISCPNGRGFDIITLKEKSWAIDPEHVNLFNPESIKLLLEACKFEVLEITTPGRLDTEFVHESIKEGKLDISNNPFLKRVLLDEWDKLGWPFQQFLAENSLSSHMWIVARKK